MIRQIASTTEICLHDWQGFRLILALFLGWWFSGGNFAGVWGCIIEYLCGIEFGISVAIAGYSFPN
jgi:hypothetical protein